MSHLNSKICLSVKGSVYLSLYSDSHRKWSSVVPPSDFCFPLKCSLNPLQQKQTVFRTSWYGGCFFFSTPVSAEAHNLPCSSICLTPFFANLPYGQLELRFMLVFFCFMHSRQLSPFTGHTAVAVSLGEGIYPRKFQPARDASENTRDDTS